MRLHPNLRPKRRAKIVSPCPSRQFKPSWDVTPENGLVTVYTGAPPNTRGYGHYVAEATTCSLGQAGETDKLRFPLSRPTPAYICLYI